MRHLVLVLALGLALQLVAGCSSSAPAPVAPRTSAPTTAEAPAAAPAQPGAAQTSWDRYVIRTAEVALIVADVEAASAEVTRIAGEAGGYVGQSNLHRDGSRVFADVSIQVPAAAFEQVIDQLRGLAEIVDSVRTSSQDVTEEYVDNEASLRNLRAAEESTLRLLAQASKMEDVLAVERELTRIRGEIEKIEGRQRYLKRRVDMSTINVRLSTEAGASLASSRAGWQLLRNAATAWEASLTFLSILVDVTVTLVVFFWWAIPLVVAIVWLWRRRRSRRRQQAPPAPLQPPLQPQSSAE